MLHIDMINELKSIYLMLLRTEAEREKEEQERNHRERVSRQSEGYQTDQYSDVRYSLSMTTMFDINNHMEFNLKTFVPFKDRLAKHIMLSGFKKDSDFYKKCGLSRQHFSKIMGWRRYIPKKKTIMAMALTLELSLEDAKELLSSAGYSLSNSDKTDWVVRYCFENKIFDLLDVNEALAIFQEPPLM